MMAQQRELTARFPAMTASFNAQRAQLLALQATVQAQEQELLRRDAAAIHSQAELQREQEFFRVELASFQRRLQEAEEEKLAAIRECREAETTSREINRRLVAERQTFDEQRRVGLKKIEELAGRCESARDELANYRAGEAGRLEKHKREILNSPEVSDMLGMRAAKMLEFGFAGAVDQIREAGFIPKDQSLDFLDARKVIENLPDDAL